MTDEKYKDCSVGIHSVTFFLLDEDGNVILNEDGTIKLFTEANGDYTAETLAEFINPEDLEEV